VHRFVQEKRSEIDVTIAALQMMSKYLADLAAEHPLNSACAVASGASSSLGDPRSPACANASGRQRHDSTSGAPMPHSGPAGG
jgi:hypothetical protein